ncbi:MAG: bifunctional DNA-formamidopyrimidine glycosylase/DNA-(apurinic or apyrimidinic site) lyase [Candidatus Margulisiibacteriota bacterium]|jgi:formamidopyrimidine-DNA glycosylase
MPELPEVETIRGDLNKKILGKKIKDVKISKPKIIKGNVNDFKKVLQGSFIKKIDRVGKLMIFVLSKSDKFLLIHLKMTGQLIYVSRKETISGGHNYPKIDKLPNKFSHIIFTFTDKSKLFYNDIRQFGYMKIVNKEGLKKVFSNFGLDPVATKFKKNDFLRIIKDKKNNIKAFLLNQKFIAGIGNIYADEILFDSRIKPSRRIDSLKNREKEKLYLSIKKILKKAIRMRGTTFSNYVDGRGNKGNFTNFLKVYQRQGHECFKCGKKVRRIKIAGRGTHYCLVCQR